MLGPKVVNGASIQAVKPLIPHVSLQATPQKDLSLSQNTWLNRVYSAYIDEKHVAGMQPCRRN